MHIKEKLSFVAGQIEVDVISTKGFELAAEAIKTSVVAEVFGKNVKVVTPEYLILLKLLPLSSQDAIDIKALSKKADMRRLKALAEKHFLLSKLETLITNKLGSGLAITLFISSFTPLAPLRNINLTLLHIYNPIAYRFSVLVFRTLGLLFP
ncbi:MAG: hypothetical protein WC855_07975 [Thermodesulfovibrionales bacterium]